MNLKITRRPCPIQLYCEMESMSVEQMLQHAVEIPHTAYTRYQTNKNKNPNFLFCFVEGVDDSDYYMNVVSQCLGDNYYFIPCDNKKNLLDIYGEIYIRDREKYKVAFFCDRDYDEPLNYEGCYETPCYAIENLYTNRNAFERYLKYGLKIDAESDCYNKAIEKYDKCFSSFHLAIKDFNCYASAKNKLDKEGIIKSIKRFDKKVDNLVKVYFDRDCVQLYSVSSLNMRLESNPAIPEEIVALEEERLNLLDAFYWYRGKYELNFYLKFLEFLKNDANGKQSCIANCKIKDNYNGATFLRDFCQFADVDVKLKQFVCNYNTESK